MKLKRFPQKLLRKRPSRTTPSTRQPLATNPPTTVSDTAGFYTTPEGPGVGYPRLLNQHDLKCLASSLAIAASVEDNIHPSHIPSRPDAAPAPRSGGSLRFPTWANNPECTDCARLRSPERTPVRCRPAPTRRTPCRLQLR